MDFDQIYKSIIPSQQSILEQVDEYTLFCYYTGLEPLILGKASPCPYRRDDIPSFSVFPSKGSIVEYMWKDHATGEYGNIFRLVQKIEQLDSLQEVYGRINDDFGLSFCIDNPERREKIEWYTRPQPNEIDIRILNQDYTQKGKAFWDQFGIKKDLLDFYNVSQVKFYWTYVGQECPKVAPDPMFSYNIGGYYQLYSPYAPKVDKFRNNLPENYFFGYIQLPKTGERLIIDKSSKDVIFCRRLGYYAISGKSETTFISTKKIMELKERFSKIFIMLDSDEPGRAMTQKYLNLYPWLVPKFLPKHKDKTDFCKAEGFDETKRIVDSLLSAN